jgi:hypothetical protein
MNFIQSKFTTAQQILAAAVIFTLVFSIVNTVFADHKGVPHGNSDTEENGGGNDTELQLTCDVALEDGVWVFSGVWSAQDFNGQYDQYDVKIESPVGTEVDASSDEDEPDDTFTVTGEPTEPGNTTAGPKSDMAGTWSNQVEFAVPPTEVLAVLFHTQGGGADDSAACDVDLSSLPACSDGVDNNDAEDSLVDYPADPGCIDVNDDDETDVIVPNEIPVISLLGVSPINVTVGNAYVDAGATAADTEDGDITANIVTVNSVNTAAVGTYTVTYNVTDGDGASAVQVSRTVNVVPLDPTNVAPVITLLGSTPVTVTQGTTYTDAGATAADTEDGDITASLVIVNPVDTATVGEYTVTYNVTDGDGASATQVTRTVNVIADSNGGGNQDVDTFEIKGYVWHDRDRDSDADENENALAGWVIHARNGDQDVTGTTDENGNYVITVTEGTWTVSQDIPNGWKVAPNNSDSYTFTFPEDIEEDESVVTMIMNAIIPTAYAALIGEVTGVDFGNTETSGGGGGGSSSNSSSNNNDDDPAGEVLGAQTTDIPAGAPNTGAGGTSASPIATLISLFGMVMSFATLRFAKVYAY